MHSGDVVWNPLTGEKAMLVEPAKESGGARIVTDFAVEAGGFVPGGVDQGTGMAPLRFLTRQARR
jgi:hypothetical protein